MTKKKRGPKPRTDEHFNATYVSTPQNEENISRVRSISSMWRNTLKSNSDVICFCVAFVQKNIKIIDEQLRKQ
ncbi:MAG: hypothetical protein WC998_02940 [Candidatus Paceibacterota bacterium]